MKRNSTSVSCWWDKNKRARRFRICKALPKKPKQFRPRIYFSDALLPPETFPGQKRITK